MTTSEPDYRTKPRERGKLHMVYQFTYGEIQCAVRGCIMIKEVRMFTTRGGRKRYVLTSEEDTRYYAYKAGWRQDRKGLYYCPLHTPIPEERKPIPKAVRELAEICGVVIE